MVYIAKHGNMPSTASQRIIAAKNAANKPAIAAKRKKIQSKRAGRRKMPKIAKNEPPNAKNGLKNGRFSGLEGSERQKIAGLAIPHPLRLVADSKCRIERPKDQFIKLTPFLTPLRMEQILGLKTG